MPLRVGFDLDGTLADMYAALHREAEQLFGREALKAATRTTEPAKPNETDSKEGQEQNPEDNPAMTELHLTERQQAQLWDHVKTIENFWSTLPEMETGIIARLAALSEARRWEVIFLTTRPGTAGETTQLQSQRWLNAKGFPFPSVYVVQRSRGRIADALQLDIVVDDRPENCLDVAIDSKARALLIWAGDPRGIPRAAERLGVRAVPSISEALRVIERMDDARRSGVMGTIKRMLGRGEPRIG
jgi:beta-phosphoglucomutase-like phosphatase (HAD superfamily)